MASDYYASQGSYTVYPTTFATNSATFVPGATFGIPPGHHQPVPREWTPAEPETNIEWLHSRVREITDLVAA